MRSFKGLNRKEGIQAKDKSQRRKEGIQQKNGGSFSTIMRIWRETYNLEQERKFSTELQPMYRNYSELRSVYS